ncbi:hypothetical protein [Pseudochryseolinea flava]|uniref:Uncharacterized protein n=1 Tax=Pseudochryseolinea flava TaxID=2059302 RepID=A0A364Y4X7_9BACT|nr:hypothetical protein [Pseudochryseolinea flava]RAW01993.1 hypothetical protein DQQ10_05395 [Pseudochryseolinea flava]
MKIKIAIFFVAAATILIACYGAIAQEAPKMNKEENARIDSLAIAYKLNDKREKLNIEKKRLITKQKEKADSKLKAKDANRLSSAERKGRKVRVNAIAEKPK